MPGFGAQTDMGEFPMGNGGMRSQGGQMEERFGGMEMPDMELDGMPEGRETRRFIIGEMPEGMELPEIDGELVQRGGGGRGGMQAGGSIVTFAVNRLDNLKKQLSGEIATTGNTTMNMGMGMGGGRGESLQGQERTESIKVKLNGTEISFDQNPVIEGGYTLVPLRQIFEVLGAEIDWDESTQTVTAVKGEMAIVLTIGERYAYVNEERVELDKEAMVINGRTLVPVRFISEAFGLDVDWDSGSQTVIIEGHI